MYVFSYTYINTSMYVYVYTHARPSIFVCASLYVALMLINSHKAKKAGGKSKYAALVIFGETLSELRFLLRRQEQSSSILHKRLSLPTSTPLLQLAQPHTSQTRKYFQKLQHKFKT